MHFHRMVIFGLLCSFIAMAHAEEEPLFIDDQAAPQDLWESQATLYFWLPSIEGDVAVAGIPSSVDVSISTILEESTSIFVLNGQVQAWYDNQWVFSLDAAALGLDIEEGSSAGRIAFDGTLHGPIFGVTLFF